MVELGGSAVNNLNDNLLFGDSRCHFGNASEPAIRAIAGDRNAREQLFKMHAGKLYRTAFAVLGNKEDTEDALQESWFRAYGNLKSFEGRSSFSTWLTRIVINSGLMILRKNRVDLYASSQLGPTTEILHARLLAVAIKSAKGVNDDERRKLLEQWERVTFRIFGLFDKDSRTKVGDYVRLAAKIVTEDIETRTYNQIMGGLRELGQQYPIAEALEEGLIGKDYYDHPEECRYLLWSLEEHLAQELGAGATVDVNEKIGIWKLRASDSIEHIFPQNPSGSAWRGKMRLADGTRHSHEANVGRIGNLLLLPVPLNQEAQNFSFDKKKETYEKHNLRMVQEVCKESDWTLSEIETREARIVAWAKTRWCDV